MMQSTKSAKRFINRLAYDLKVFRKEKGTILDSMQIGGSYKNALKKDLVIEINDDMIILCHVKRDIYY